MRFLNIRSIVLITISLFVMQICSSCAIRSRSKRESPQESDNVVIQFDQSEDEKGNAEEKGREKRGSITEAAEPVVKELGQTVSYETSNRQSNTNLNEFRLGYGDVIEVKFFKNPEYNEVVSVRPDGKISLQQVGDLNVINMTVSSLDAKITRAYSEILIDPDVTVIVREFNGQFCYVAGEVEEPGQYDVSKGMTVLRSIVAAGGAKKSGKMNSVILIRGDEQRNVQVSRLDLSFSSIKSNLRSDIAIQPYDVVYVPRTFIANLDDFIKRIYDYAVPPLDLWVRYKFWSRWDD